MAAAALERLDREINGEAVGAVGRRSPRRRCWRRRSCAGAARAALRGGSLRLRLAPPARPAVDADRREISQALDNLIVNAIEHGGPGSWSWRRRLRLERCDSR